MRKLILLLFVPLYSLGQLESLDNSLFELNESYNYLLAEALEETYFYNTVKLNETKNNIIEYENGQNNTEFGFKQKSYSSFESDYQDLIKLKIAAKDIYLLNINPYSRDKDYLDLFWKRAVESFGFVDVFYFREKYGHNYRDIRDYSYTFLKQWNYTYTGKLKEVLLGPKGDSSLWSEGTMSFTQNLFNQIKRSRPEQLVELAGLSIPLIFYTLMLFFLFKISYVNKLAIRFLLFAHNNKLQLLKHTNLTFRYLLIPLSIVFFYLALDNLRLITQNSSFWTPNGILEIGLTSFYRDDINYYASVTTGWHIVILKFLTYTLIAYAFSFGVSFFQKSKP